MDDKEKKAVLDSYGLKAMTSSDYKVYLAKYSKLMDEGVYVLKDIRTK